MGLLHTSITGLLPLIPTPLMRRIAARYIAGEEMSDALAMLETLRGQGYRGIIDLLGEHVNAEAEARQVAATYRRAAQELSARQLDAYVSIKPTHLGLQLSEELCLELYDEVATLCGDLDVFVRVEMEDHPTTDATLRIFEALRARHRQVGIVLQSRLFRTPADIDALGSGPLQVRLVKGIYLEPGHIAHTSAESIREAYLVCCRKLFERGASLSLATHDGPMSERLLALVAELGVEPERYEFQVLLGVQERLWEHWRDAGHPVRVYVPYGPQWRVYSQRRLRKNPQILGHVMRAGLRHTFGRD